MGGLRRARCLEVKTGPFLVLEVLTEMNRRRIFLKLKDVCLGEIGNVDLAQMPIFLDRTGRSPAS